MKTNLTSLLICSLCLILNSCSLEKEIDLNLPEYESKLVVECYLEPGEQYRLALTESVDYFDPRINPIITDALVIINYNGDTDTLKFGITSDATGKIYNYSSPQIVPVDYFSEFSIEVRDIKGRVVTGKTTIPVPALIDTVEFRYNEDSLAFPLTKFYDNRSLTNYYRYQVTRDSYLGDELTDFIFDDKLITSSQIALGSSYELKKGDSVIVSLYNINKDYFDFLNSVNSAIDANGNPFGQPASIKSNVQGGLGIFTGLSRDRKILVTN